MRKVKPYRVARIFGAEVPVFKVKGLSDSHYSAWGIYETHENKEESRILIDDSMESCMGERILIHEMLHATFDRTNVTNSLPEGLEEIIVDQCARMIRDNFKLTWK